MTNIPFNVFLLGLCLLVAQPASAADLSQITWINSLATEQAVTDFLSSTHGMAEEVLRLSTDKPPVVMMGRNTTSKLTLAKCLEIIYTQGAISKELFLLVSTMEIYEATVKVLEQANAKAWVTLKMSVFPGPNGNTPAIQPADMKKHMKDEVRKFFGFEDEMHSEEHACGYTIEMLEALVKNWKFAGFHLFPDLGYSVDIDHISTVDMDVKKAMADFLRKNVQWSEHFMPEEKHHLVNVSYFKAYMELINIKQSYLNVNEQFREEFFRSDDQTTEGSETNASGRVLGEIRVIVGVVVIFCFL